MALVALRFFIAASLVLPAAAAPAPMAASALRAATPQRNSAAAAGGAAEDAPATAGRLEDALGEQPACRGKEAAFPIHGVQYTPHLVGEPYPHPESKPWGYYTKAYATMHRRDLPLIGRYVGADTLRLRAWPTDGSSGERAAFFEEMHRNGVCKVIPTFQAAKYYANALRQGLEKPETDPSSALAVDFARFGASVAPAMLGDIEMVAWSIDLSLDMAHLLPLIGSDCRGSKITEDKSFQKYVRLLNAIDRWMNSAASVTPSLRDKPFLLPLDVSRVPWYEPNHQTRLNLFIDCLSKDSMEGGWMATVFSSKELFRRARWLLSFAIPVDQMATYNFHHQLQNITKTMKERAIIMAGTQALERGGLNPINSVNLREATDVQNSRYQDLHDDYSRVSVETSKLDGFIYDEWSDDWDRGARGPFYLAADTIDGMLGQCVNGGRFSHDINGGSRVVGNNGQVYPEFLGLAATSSQVLKHCVQPRFSQSLFGENVTGTNSPTRHCAYMVPAHNWIFMAMGLLVAVVVVQAGTLARRWFCGEGFRRMRAARAARTVEAKPQPEFPERHTGHVTICPVDKALGGGHNFELTSKSMRDDGEAAWWLWTHVSTQIAILEKQVQVEVKATQANRSRRLHHPKSLSKISTFLSTSSEISEESGAEDDLATAVRVIHRRTLEGFSAWCSYVSQSARCVGSLDHQDLRTLAKSVEDNADRHMSLLFAESLLLRTMESLGEHLLQCPERLSYLLFHVLVRADIDPATGSTTFALDLDEMHDGLVQMDMHSNPFVRAQMPNGHWELGLNFDDINECGIQCREKMAKTFKEPASCLVVVDFILCYRVPFMLKLYCLGIAAYVYLGSGMGDDITTTYNGYLWAPAWLRINFIQYTALLDACIWTALEALLVSYTLWQRWPSLGYASPGIPGLKWFLEHMLNLCLSAFGGLWVYKERRFLRKPWECAQSDLGSCVDERTELLWMTLQYALIYWVCRLTIFTLMNVKHYPIFIIGTPNQKSRTDSGRGCFASWLLDLRVNLAWCVMLSVCIFVEVYLLLPSMRGLDWTTTCGMDLLGTVTGMPEQHGVCSELGNESSFKCVACVASVCGGWLLVFLGSLVDVYFVFYLAAAVVGSVMGHRRQLNDLKNTSLPVDLRDKGREAQLFEKSFGPQWQLVWRVMVKGLLQESLISPKQASSLCHAAGISLESEVLPTQRDKVQKPIHLTRFPGLAAERLAFFFQSLKWVETNGSGKKNDFVSKTDALTGSAFDVGSIPSLTQIIPAYNEVVIPEVAFLRAGADPEDARNSSPDDQPGLGDLTVPPQGDGVNTNLAFMISQFPDEWVFLAQRLHKDGFIESGESQDLYHNFMKAKLAVEVVTEVRIWACLRMQTVAKTVIGALQYAKALAALPAIKEHYSRFPEKRVAEDHVEVILAHQTFGHSDGIEKNDEAVQLLLQRHADDPLFLVFEVKKGTTPALWRMVENFLTMHGGFVSGGLEQASVKCKWDKARACLRVVSVIPRKFPLRLGQGDYKTQGKACNQLNGLRFASGHYVQALDCNMGAFIGEGFKVPYVLRQFMPLDKEDRSAPRCRYLGFREYIYTGREGTVGKCHAAAEWTFGTIYQRFLSGMGMRMHYGHPDFLDGFWARNRGGMSKSSPVVNLSEDIFAGYNVRMREEASPHIDALEFEKGREATFNAASNFFSKIAGGSIAMLRSRDNHLLCERIGILHSLSFYFASVAFYMSNLLVDMSIYLYVILFIFFNLAGLGPGELAALGSTFSTEWIVSMGIVTLVPMLCEMVLEHGAVHAIRQVVGGIGSATFFYIFQNKCIASSMKEGAMTGIARYIFTGRPQANQHQTWRDIYVTYWKSHYQPAMFLISSYLIYILLASQNHGKGKLPMVLVLISCVAWIITPIVFSPFPRWNLIRQDLREFSAFITGGAGTSEREIPEVQSRGRRSTVRSLYECGLAEEMAQWTESHVFMLLLTCIFKVAVAIFLLYLIPSEILDFVPVYGVALAFSWVVVLGYMAGGLNNVFLVLSFLVWPAAIPLAPLIIGDRFSLPNVWIRMPEYVIAMMVFLYLVGLAKDVVLISCRLLHDLFPCLSRKQSTGHMHECVRLCFVYFLVHQIQFVQAYVVLLANLLTSIALAVVDKVFCNVHTWFMLNSELARTPHGERYMEKTATFYEQDYLGGGLDLWSSDSELGSPRDFTAEDRI